MLNNPHFFRSYILKIWLIILLGFKIIWFSFTFQVNKHWVSKSEIYLKVLLICVHEGRYIYERYVNHAYLSLYRQVNWYILHHEYFSEQVYKYIYTHMLYNVCMFTFSLISSARLHRGSASLYLPRFPYRTARLFNVAATCEKNVIISRSIHFFGFYWAESFVKNYILEITNKCWC